MASSSLEIQEKATLCKKSDISELWWTVLEVEIEETLFNFYFDASNFNIVILHISGFFLLFMATWFESTIDSFI